MNQEIAEIKTDRVNPIKITDEKTGQVYELDFSRESVRFAEARGFKADEIAVFPVTRIPELLRLQMLSQRMRMQQKTRK